MAADNRTHCYSDSLIFDARMKIRTNCSVSCEPSATPCNAFGCSSEIRCQHNIRAEAQMRRARAELVYNYFTS